MKSCIYQILIVLFFATPPCTAQNIDSLSQNMENLPGKFLTKVQKKYSSISASLSRKTNKYLQKMQRQEKRIQRKATKSDSANIPGTNVDSIYAAFRSRPSTVNNPLPAVGKINLHQYNPFIDTLSTSLDFLKGNKGLADKVKLPSEALDRLKGQFNETEKVKEFIAQRKEQIKEALSKFTKIPPSLKNQYANIQKTEYYYTAQVKEYRDLLSSPEKIEKQALGLLSRMPFFQKFMKENSQLASMFRLPDNSTGSTVQSLAGLQTRASVQGLIQQRIAAGGPNAMATVQQNLATAHAEIDKLKDKLSQMGNSGSSDLEMPGFKPNSQKTKSLLRRLEYGFNVQFEKSNSFMPTTSNLALTLGYKLNDKGAIGVGMSYKLGLGTLQHIRFSSQGVGLQSYLDWKVTSGKSKIPLFANLSVSGGYELNFNSGFKNIEQLKHYSLWQRSALLGISKKVGSIPSPFGARRKGAATVQLLYDFLARDHRSVSSPVVVRMEYKF